MHLPKGHTAHYGQELPSKYKNITEVKNTP
jgi:hypothetical protein